MARPAYSAISSPSRVRILGLLQQRDDHTVAELVRATDLHANTVREHLQRLIDGGYVVAATEQRTTRGRPRVLYRLATGEESASSPIARRKAHAAALRGDLMRRVLPESTSHRLDDDATHQLDALVDDLESAGFEPVVDEDSLTLDLSPCEQVATTPGERELRCSVHLRLMQSVLAEAGGPLRVDGLAPTCDPTTCVVLLSR